MASSVQSNEFDYEGALMACARGDQRELQKIYEREAGRLLGVAYRILRRRDLADQAVHDGFLQILAKSRDLRSGARQRAWLDLHGGAASRAQHIARLLT